MIAETRRLSAISNWAFTRVSVITNGNKAPGGFGKSRISHLAHKKSYVHMFRGLLVIAISDQNTGSRFFLQPGAPRTGVYLSSSTWSDTT